MCRQCAAMLSRIIAQRRDGVAVSLSRPPPAADGHARALAGRAGGWSRNFLRLQVITSRCVDTFEIQVLWCDGVMILDSSETACKLYRGGGKEAHEKCEVSRCDP